MFSPSLSPQSTASEAPGKRSRPGSTAGMPSTRGRITSQTVIDAASGTAALLSGNPERYICLLIKGLLHYYFIAHRMVFAYVVSFRLAAARSNSRANSRSEKEIPQYRSFLCFAECVSPTVCSQEEGALLDTDLGGEGASMKSEAWAVEDIAKAFLVERYETAWL